MKYLIYKIEGLSSVYNRETEELQEVPILSRVKMPYSEANEEIAKREAYNGDYEIEDDGQPEQDAPPPDGERIAELEEAINLLLEGATNE